MAPEVTGYIVSCAVCDDKESEALHYHFRGPKPCPPGVTAPVDGRFENVPVGYTQCFDDEVQKQWKTVFWIGAGLCYFGAAFYLVFASGKVQSWNTSTTAKRGLITRLVNDGE